MSIEFEKVAINALKTIDNIRSRNSDLKNIDGNSVKPIESRIHAMYRAIGIPAYITDPDKKNNFNNGNVFKIDDKAAELVGKRKEEDDKFSLPISESDVKTLLDTTPDKIISSIDDSIKRRKGSLFPIIVNGDIDVLPQNKRVAGAFYKTNTEDGIMVGDVQYRRPLIEMIVLMRLKEDGLVNSVAEQLLQDEEAFADLKADKFFSSNGKPTGENILSVDTLGSLLLAIFNREGVRKILDSTVRDLGRIRAEVRGNPKISSGDYQASQHQSTSGTDGKGTLEQMNKTRGDLIARNNAKITLLEYDDTFGNQSTKNNKDYMLASIIIDAMLAESTTIDDQIAEEENKKKKLKQAQRNHNKNIDLLLGKFSGISGVDVLIIIAGLFAISKDDLLGLLNNDSLARLLSIKSNTEIGSKNVKADLNKKLGVSITETPIAALQSLEEKVRQLFNKFEKEIKISDMVKKNNTGA